jgi:hypothetical protein
VTETVCASVTTSPLADRVKLALPGSVAWTTNAPRTRWTVARPFASVVPPNRNDPSSSSLTETNELATGAPAVERTCTSTDPTGGSTIDTCTACPSVATAAAASAVTLKSCGWCARVLNAPMTFAIVTCPVAFVVPANEKKPERSMWT